MSGKPRKENRGKTERIELRLSTPLKQAIEEYSEKNLESVMETATRAIKEYVGFGVDKPVNPTLYEENDLPKDERLEIRVHPQLKEMILDLQKKLKLSNSSRKAGISAIVLSALMQYIGYSVKE